uniref:Uncharacterized protein n=1 Tax=Sarcophilus harrisii TaxID=9305 RepID=A0A7N4P1N3_SARHA
MATLGMATVTVCTPLAAGTQLPARVTRPGPAGDGAGMRRSDRPLWSSGDESYASELNYLLSECSLRRKDRSSLLQYNVTDSQRNISSFSKEQNRMPVLTPENRYLTSRVTKSSLDGCFLFEKSWKKAALETQKMKKEYSSIFGLKDFKEVDTIPSLPEVQTYRTNTETPLDVLKRHPCAALKTSKIRLPTEKNSRNEISSLNEDMPTCLPSFSLPQKPRQQSVKEENLKNRSMKSYQTSSLLSLQEKTKAMSACISYPLSDFREMLVIGVTDGQPELKGELPTIPEGFLASQMASYCEDVQELKWPIVKPPGNWLEGNRTSHKTASSPGHRAGQCCLGSVIVAATFIH